MLPSLLEILKTPITPHSVLRYTCFHLLLPLLIEPAAVPISTVGEFPPFHFNAYACSPGKGLRALSILYFIKATD